MRIRAGRLIDGTGGPVQERVIVVIADGRIQRVQPDDGGDTVGEETLDARDATILPGLINCHEHLSFKRRPGSVADMMREPLPYLALQAAQSARWDLQHGITSVRSTGDKEFTDVIVGRAIVRGVTEGPRVVAAGPPLVMTGGHGYPIAWEVDGVEGMRQAARKLLKEGSDHIKIITSGGMAKTRPGEGTMHVEFFLEEIRAAVEVAHHAERKVAAHAHGPAAIKNVLDAGVDSVEHGTLLTEELVDRMAATGTYLVPTLSQIEEFAERGPEHGKPRFYQEAAREIRERNLRCVENAVRAGVNIVTGTDGVGDLVDEVGLLTHVGMTPLQAIHAATGRAARLIGLPVGELRPGCLADILVVDGDPSVDTADLRKVRTVVWNGRVAYQARGC